MLRFILKRESYEGVCLNALHRKMETVDCEVPELEAILSRGGLRLGGPDGDAFDTTELVGVEILERTKGERNA